MSAIGISDIGVLSSGVDLNESHAGRFRHVQTLSFVTGGEAETARIAADTDLDVLFFSRSVNALSASAPEAAQLSTQSSNLVLSLPVARKIKKIRLSDPVSQDRISAFRFDGDAVSDDPVTSQQHLTSGATLNVTDSQIILRRKNDGVEYPLIPEAIDQVIVRYGPVNPRLSLRLVGEETEIPFPAKLDDEGVPIFPTNAAFGEEFATALQTVLDAAPQPLPNPLQIELILSADQPCRARVTDISVQLELEKHAFDEKALLRFSGARRQQEAVKLNLPMGADLLGGTLSLTVTGTPPRARVQTALDAATLTSTDQGISVSMEHPVATQITMPAPIAVAAAEIILAVPDGACTLRAVLHADTNGVPGEALIESAESSISDARPKTIRFAFEPLALPAGPIWLSIAVQSGRAVAMIGGPGHIARARGPYFTLFKGLEVLGLAAQIQAAENAPQSAPASAGPVVAINGEVLGAVGANGATNFDLGAFGPHISTAQELTISSAARAVVTVDPVILRYAMTQ